MIGPVGNNSTQSKSIYETRSGADLRNQTGTNQTANKSDSPGVIIDITKRPRITSGGPLYDPIDLNKYIGVSPEIYLKEELERLQGVLAKQVDQKLADNGIHLSEQENLSLRVDGDFIITVTGLEDKEKMAKIAEVLNRDDSIGNALFHFNIKTKELNGEGYDRMTYKKWQVNDYLKYEVGQSLDDLKAVNGSIVGANDRLTKILRMSNTPSQVYMAQGLKNDILSLLRMDYQSLPDIVGYFGLRQDVVNDKLALWVSAGLE